MKTAKEKLKEFLEAERVPRSDETSRVAMVNIDRFVDFVADELHFDEAFDDEGWEWE